MCHEVREKSVEEVKNCQKRRNTEEKKEIGTVEEGINRNEQGKSYTEQGTRNKEQKRDYTDRQGIEAYKLRE